MMKYFRFNISALLFLTLLVGVLIATYQDPYGLRWIKHVRLIEKTKRGENLLALYRDDLQPDWLTFQKKLNRDPNYQFTVYVRDLIQTKSAGGVSTDK